MSLVCHTLECEWNDETDCTAPTGPDIDDAYTCVTYTEREEEDDAE